MRVSLVVLCAFAASAAALPASTRYVVHEKRGNEASWSEVSHTKPDKRITLPVRIGLKQTNLDQGHDILMDIAHPDSKNYGKHWNAQQVSITLFDLNRTIDRR